MSIIPKHKGQRVYSLLKNRKTNSWDVIVIGSGIAGMSCAATLAKTGKKVLVLEQHNIPGGYTHMFTRKGFSWDVGVHAIGQMEPRSRVSRLLGWLTDQKMKWNSLGNPYDEFYFPDHFSIGFPDNREKFESLLKEKFPHEVPAIEQFFKICRKAVKESIIYFYFKTLPEWKGKLVSWAWFLFKRNWWKTTTTQIMDEIGVSPKLRSVLTAQWGYYGSIPNESSFAVHALTTRHFYNGAYYPEHGAKSFATHLLNTVYKAGGETLCDAEVDSLLIENKNAVGVQLKTGETFRAPLIVSAIPAKTTVNQLIPKKDRFKTWKNSINHLGNSPSYICLNLGFEGDIASAGASATNKWFNSSWDMNVKEWDVSDPKSEPPILYVSFPSFKDPYHEPGEKNKQTGECITFVPWNVFEKWKNSSYRKRDASYIEFKKEMEERLIHHLKHHMPDIMKHLTYHEISTPLTSNFFVGAVHGAIYGLESTPQRFKCSKLRMRTPIKNFYMAGVDTLIPGVVGGMMSGFLTAATIDKSIYSKLK